MVNILFTGTELSKKIFLFINKMKYIPCVIKGSLYLYPTYFKKFMLIPQGLKCSVLLFYSTSVL